MAVPVTFPLAATIAKGVGTGAKIGSDLASALGTFTKEDKDRMAELQRMTEVGEFLTDEERASYFQGIGSQEREAFQRGIGDVSAFDLGGGRFVAQQMAQQEAIAERRGEAQSDLRVAEAAAKTEAKNEMQELETKRAEERAAIWQAALGGVGQAADFYGDTAYRLDDARDREDDLMDFYEQKASSGGSLTAAQQQTYSDIRNRYRRG